VSFNRGFVKLREESALFRRCCSESSPHRPKRAPPGGSGWQARPLAIGEAAGFY
jgi:hypothetical protein